MPVLDWIAQHLRDIGIVLFMGGLAAFVFAAWCALVRSGDISDHERRERVDPFPHGPKNNSKEGHAL